MSRNIFALLKRLCKLRVKILGGSIRIPCGNATDAFRTIGVLFMVERNHRLDVENQLKFGVGIPNPVMLFDFINSPTVPLAAHGLLSTRCAVRGTGTGLARARSFTCPHQAWFLSIRPAMGRRKTGPVPFLVVRSALHRLPVPRYNLVHASTDNQNTRSANAA